MGREGDHRSSRDHRSSHSSRSSRYRSRSRSRSVDRQRSSHRDHSRRDRDRPRDSDRRGYRRSGDNHRSDDRSYKSSSRRDSERNEQSLKRALEIKRDFEKPSNYDDDDDIEIPNDLTGSSIAKHLDFNSKSALGVDLNEKFVWKKNAREKKSGDATARQLRDIQRQKRNLERKTIMREERLREREAKEQLENEQALKNTDEHEKKLMMKNMAEKCRINLRENNPTPIDVIARNILCATDDKVDEADDVEWQSPYKIISDLSIDELISIIRGNTPHKASVRGFQLLFKGTDYEQFWHDVETVCEYFIYKLEAADKDVVNGINNVNEKHVLRQLRKLRNDPKAMEMLINAQEFMLAEAPMNDDINIDTEFVEGVVDRANVVLAEERMKLVHKKSLMDRLKLIQMTRAENQEGSTTDGVGFKMPAPDAKLSEIRSVLEPIMHAAQEANKEEELEKDAQMLDFEASADDIAQLRGSINKDDEEELEPSDEVKPDALIEVDSKGRKLIKPRYFVKVKTGIEWNRYNRAHYDYDNPPPKNIQGYKFHVFYKHLQDPLTPPRYILEASDEEDFCMIRFTAGPPYKDIAFKIKNQEWNKGRRSAYRSLFERGVLELNFDFKRLRYRK
eukprot:TRINITY_DN8955_c0_g1_i1.p1 TRINITY_DN8955_c0_g1~~TRINITY_DN8955_c0_g1_i1.p1  ORF type:complete len:620 (-),score=199.27 TRINITY_DN8955_c0_g1_i1:277-2136(-)